MRGNPMKKLTDAERAVAIHELQHAKHSFIRNINKQIAILSIPTTEETAQAKFLRQNLLTSSQHLIKKERKS